VIPAFLEAIRPYAGALRRSARTIQRRRQGANGDGRSPTRLLPSAPVSGRITDEHRLVHRVENRTVLIAQARHHY